LHKETSFVVGWLGRLVGRGEERSLFTTHRSEFQCPEWAVGEVLSHEGVLYQVTRWVELGRVPLVRGGSVYEWQVWGRPIKGKELEDAVSRAAERILREAGGTGEGKR
jgi:hypothetical protein